MNLGELRAEVRARGFDYVTDARINNWVNQAVRRINDLESWPWLDQSNAAATPPVSISSLKTVQSVVDVSQGFRSLDYMDRRDLVATYGDLSTTGAPRFYYLVGGVLNVYPVGGSVQVQFEGNGATLSADSDVPTIPVAYHDVIVDEAVRRAYKDTDNLDAANVLAADIAVSVDGMRNAMLDQQDSGVELLTITHSGDWL